MVAASGGAFRALDAAEAEFFERRGRRRVRILDVMGEVVDGHECSQLFGRCSGVTGSN
ncbi:hypothetical protein GCM10010464_43400 [Pseudonocardia yunnanensis]|uniref:Uncharacterized protein n=1 Tax=Pseudonocardia yunnanensis TaxID=58107 RepID=A0ABW4F586_9PSEU